MAAWKIHSPKVGERRGSVCNNAPFSNLVIVQSLSKSSRLQTFAAAWLHGIGLCAWWFAVESIVELSWGNPERGRMAVPTLAASLAALGLLASSFPTLARWIRRPIPGQPQWQGRSLDPWWVLVTTFAVALALPGHNLLIGRVSAPGAVAGALGLALASVVFGAVVPLVAARITRVDPFRDRLLHAWTRVAFLAGVALLKLELHCAELTDTPRAREFQLFVVAAASLVALAAIPWALRSRQQPPRFGLAIRFLSPLTLACGLQAWQHSVANALFLEGTEGKRDGPSALLVIVDTLRADRLTNYGYPHPTSPRLGEFAQRAVQFDRAAASAPWTLPSIATIFTGRNAGQHGAGINDGEENLRTALPSGISTLAECAGRAGIATVGLASNPYLRPLFGLPRGFDAYACPLGEARARVPIRFLAPLVGIEIAPYTVAEEMVERALSWIASRTDQQFLMVLHLMDPHTPYLSEPSPWTAPAPLSRNDEVPDPALYDGEIERVDRAFGMLFDGLAELGVMEEIVVAITADHGEVLGDRGQDEWGEGDDAWFRPYDHGQNMYEELLRVPLILKLPTQASVAPRRIAELFPMIDLAPTILELIGANDTGLQAQGSSWASILTGSAPPPDRLAFASSLLYGGEAKAVFDRRYKLIVRNTPDGGEEKMLYDLLVDPLEENSNAVVSDSIRSYLEARLSELAETEIDAEDAEAVELSPAMRERLQSLGYLR
ncbi:MAG: hypothetical protein CME06_04240 [Gemmatimonadetes bacterium]|nr:hypothetical protein [Gemmatimonadota bacterium]